MHRRQRSYFKLYDHFNILTIYQVLRYKYDIKIKHMGPKIGVFNPTNIKGRIIFYKQFELIVEANKFIYRHIH